MRRDIPLDILRVSALVLMASVHFGRSVPAEDFLIQMMQFLGELAPVVFFFAYGMTFQYYAEKPLPVRVTESLQLLGLGIVHSLTLQGTPFTSEFFTFLAVSRVVLEIGVRMNPLSRGMLAAAAVLAGVAWVLNPVGTYNAFERSNQGWFPLVPWIVFVVAGYWYQKFRWHPYVPVICAASVVLGLAAWLVTGEAPTKWPMTPSFALIFGGATGLLAYGLDRLALASEPRSVEFLSRNLLLATVLHYLPIWGMTVAYKYLLADGVAPEYLPALYIILSAASVGLVYLLVVAALWSVELAQRIELFGLMVSAYPALCLLLIVGYGFLQTQTDVLGSAPLKLVGLVIMVYLAVVMTQRGARVQPAAQPEARALVDHRVRAERA